MYLHLPKPRRPFKERIRHFTPAWHAINTGTGAVASLFHIFPYDTDKAALQYTALSFELLNLLFFVVLTACGVARYMIFRGVWASMLRHPVQSLFLGCYSMGLSNLIVGAVSTIYTYFDFGGVKFLYALWALWWLNAAMSFVICFGQLHIMFTRQSHEIHTMTMVWLLPIVTMTVAASAGVDVAHALATVDMHCVCITLSVALALTTISVALTLAIFTIYLHRLVLYGLPPGISIFSAFLPLGGMGQSGYAFLLMGEIANDLFPLADAPETSIFAESVVPHVFYIGAWLLAFAAWSFATCWLFFAALALADTPAIASLPFTIMFWGTLFPNGVYARLTLTLAASFDSRVLRVWGAIYACATLILWLFAMARTLPAAWDGSLFDAPELGSQEQVEPAGINPSEKQTRVHVPDAERDAFTNSSGTLTRTRSTSSAQVNVI
ncbi:hypothetical protein M0805_008775 [Coniferiporia weirii]|nr:hypothetical protein M0805_008775 [Coniferiporia weirii]